MNRYARVVFALLVTSMIVITATLASADGGGAQIGTAIHAHIDPQTCRYARSDGHRGWSPAEIVMTIRCAVRRWPVYGGADKAIAVASCESGLNERAVSSSGTYRGVFQQSITYWAGRLRAYSPPRFDLHSPVLNGRTNVVVSIRMAHAGGWGPWSCA